MAEAFNPDEVEKFLPAIAAAGRAVLGSAKVAGKAAASKVGGAAKVAGSKAAEIGSEVASKVGDVAERAKDAAKTTEGMMTDKQKTLSQAALQAKQQMHDSQMQNTQQRRDQEQRAIETARSAASTGSQIGKAEDFEIDYDTPSHLSSGDILSPDTMCQMCKQNPAQYKAGYSSRGRPNTPIEYNLCEACFDSFGTGGAMSTYSRFIRGSPMDIAWQLLKAQQKMLVKERQSPEAMRHKREYDAAYNKRPDQVKYREELNRERRRRGIMGSHDHMDVSHTQGGKLTLEPEHSNRARHFRDKGTLRVVKSVKDDVEILRNLMQGPMDEQDKKIATAMVGMLEERHADEEEESELVQPMFGGAHLFA